MASTKRPRPRTAKNVFRDLGFAPAEAANLRIRAQLMVSLSQRIDQMSWTQVEAARRLHVTQPRISDLVRGRIDRFSVDTLMAMLAAAGVEVRVTVGRIRAIA
jgi:predicted XRE-type DNA-binding protein